MSSAKNPWDEGRLSNYIGQEENIRLEFKSGKGLKQDKEKTKKEGVNDIIKEVVALINTDGGEVLIGVEEESRPAGTKTSSGKASKIEGVSRSVMDAKRLNQTICDNISPATGSLVTVFPISLGHDEEGVENLAFAIEVKAGNTAYQFSGDKIYYGRRGSESIPLDDKDVRLRMLSDDKPRVKLSCEISSFGARQEEEYRNDFKQRQAVVNDPSIGYKQGGPFYVRKINSYRISIDINVENSGSTIIDKLGASLFRESLDGLPHPFDNSITYALEGDVYYIEKDFLKALKLPLYPQMKARLLSLNFLLERNNPHPTLTRNFRINVFLNGGGGDTLNIDLSDIAEKTLAELRERTRKVEEEFPTIDLG